MFGPKGPYCQSCGMPMSKDKKGGGTRADGSRSAEFCSHCFVAGKFTDPDLTAEQMVEKVQANMRKIHVPGFLARRFTKDIPSLKRWATQ